MNRRKVLAIIFIFSLLSAFEACAANDGSPAGDQTQSMNKVSDLIGKKLQSSNGKDLGKIQDLVYDAETHTIAYSIVSYEDRLYPVPLSAISIAPRSDKATLNLDTERFVMAPNFPKDAWPDLGNKKTISHINTYYGVAPATGGQSGMPESPVRQNEKPAAGAGVGPGK